MRNALQYALRHNGRLVFNILNIFLSGVYIYTPDRSSSAGMHAASKLGIMDCDVMRFLAVSNTRNGTLNTQAAAGCHPGPA
jgi:hypothetical protein